MLKRKLTKDEFDALPEGTKAFYKAGGTAGEYVLDMEPDTDNGALIRAKAAEKKRADEAELRIAELTTEIETLTAAAASAAPTTAALEASYKTKETKLKDDHAKELAKINKKLETLLVDNKALELATAISTTPELIAPLIKARLKANLTGEEPATEVLDANGLVSSISLEDLGKEFVANPKYGAIMIGSNASGGGARPNLGGGGASLRHGKKFADLSEAERIAWSREDAAGFRAASEAHKTSLRSP